MAGETTAVWWPPPPSPYPLLLRIRKKQAPVYSGRKFPFSTQPNGASTLSSPSPTQQLCLWHGVGCGGIGRALKGENHLQRSWDPSSCVEDVLASPQLIEMAAEDLRTPPLNHGASQVSSTGKAGSWVGNIDCWASHGGGKDGAG